MTMKTFGAKAFNVPEYTDEEARDKSTAQLLASRCIFQAQPDGSTIGLTGGARELIRRSDEYMRMITEKYLEAHGSTREALDASRH